MTSPNATERVQKGAPRPLRQESSRASPLELRELGLLIGREELEKSCVGKRAV